MTALRLAEPEPAVRGFLERQLRNDGFDVVACERAEQLPRAADPEVLLLGDAAVPARGGSRLAAAVVRGGARPRRRARLPGDRARRLGPGRARARARPRRRLP